MTWPIFCAEWNVGVTPRWTIVRSRRRECGDWGKREAFSTSPCPGCFGKMACGAGGL